MPVKVFISEIIHGYELRTVKAAVDINKDQKTMLYKKACKRLITFNGLKVAVLGLTFKPGTDDLREAPSLENVPLLLEHDASECLDLDPDNLYENCADVAEPDIKLYN